jgi:protein-S-isoprenylcysteine O-methyltransferase Ste14
MSDEGTGPRWGRDEWRSIGSLVVTLLAMGVLMFGPAGTLAWPRGWWFIAVLVALVLISMAVLWRLNPEIFAARRTIAAEGTKRWDYVIMAFVFAGFALIPPVAALDDARFHWAPTPDWLVLLGYLLLIAGFAGLTWAQAVNRHFEPSVRIQTDRGHTVIDTGPYAIVRHPGYITGSVMVVGIALSLGSLWALVPAMIVVIALVVRTLLEEQTLHAELPGYTQYAQRVTRRWIPGVW